MERRSFLGADVWTCATDHCIAQRPARSVTVSVYIDPPPEELANFKARKDTFAFAQVAPHIALDVSKPKGTV